MNAIAFDTHAHVKRLVGAGMSESQAEAVIEAVRQTAELPNISDLATKADLQITKSELQSSITAVQADLTATRSELRGEIAAVRGEMKGLQGRLIWWIIGAGAVSSVAHLFLK